MYKPRAAANGRCFAALVILSMSFIQSCSCENEGIDDEIDEGLEWPIFKAIANASSSKRQFSSVSTDQCVRNAKGICVKEEFSQDVFADSLDEAVDEAPKKSRVDPESHDDQKKRKNTKGTAVRRESAGTTRRPNHGDSAAETESMRVQAAAAVSKAAALHQAKNNAGAIEVLRKALASGLETFQVLDFLAALLAEAGRGDESLPLFERAVDLRPDSAATRFNYGLSLQKTDPRGALAQLREAVRLRPDGPEFRNSACLAEKDADPRQGLDCFRAAVRLHPARADMQNNLGSVLSSLGREDLAGRHLKRAVELQPVYPEAWRNLGRAHRELGDRPAALAAFRKAAAQRPAYANAWINVAELLAETGRSSRDVAKELQPAVAAGLWKLASQRPTHYVRHLAARPWYDSAEFEWAEGLRRATADIKAEALALASDAGFRYRTYTSRIIDKRRRGDGWKDFWLWENGRRLDERCREAPKTCKVLEEVVGSDAVDMPKGNIYFSMVEPGTTLTAHCGPTNTRIRVHLGLVCPPGARLRVGGETRTWGEGDVLVFDDSFEHEVVHDGTERRLVLIFDVWHPDLVTPQQRAAALAVPEL